MYPSLSLQTYAVLRQAHENKVATTLVINKIDKLCTELHLSPTEAYERIQKIIEQVNVTVSELYTADLMAQDHKNDTANARTGDDVASTPNKRDVRARRKVPATHTAFSWLTPMADGGVPATHTQFSWRAQRIRGQRKRTENTPSASTTARRKGKQRGAKRRRGKPLQTATTHTSDQTLKFDEADEVGRNLVRNREVEKPFASGSNQYHTRIHIHVQASKFFDPVKGNVVFASALHGWGFRLQQFAAILYREKVNTCWG